MIPLGSLVVPLNPNEENFLFYNHPGDSGPSWDFVEWPDEVGLVVETRGYWARVFTPVGSGWTVEARLFRVDEELEY